MNVGQIDPFQIYTNRKMVQVDIFSLKLNGLSLFSVLTNKNSNLAHMLL